MEELIPAIELAFSVGQRVLVESSVQGLELTCGVVRKNGIVNSSGGDRNSIRSRIFSIMKPNTIQLLLKK